MPRDPEKKKRLSYERDRVTDAEYPHAHRKSGPRKKVSLHQWQRGRDRQVLSAVAHGDADLDAPLSDELSIKPKYEKVIGTTPLGEVVTRKLDRRIKRAGWNFFKRPYQSEHDRQPFCAFVSALTEGASETSAAVAAQFQQRLDDHDPWMLAFFEDEPDWRPRLAAWIESFRSK